MMILDSGYSGSSTGALFLVPTGDFRPPDPRASHHVNILIVTSWVIRLCVLLYIRL